MKHMTLLGLFRTVCLIGLSIFSHSSFAALINNLTVNNSGGTGLAYQICPGAGASLCGSPSGFVTGAKQYVDRTYVINSSVPSSVSGQTFIMTANGDKNADAGSLKYMSFTVAQAATVYVVYYAAITSKPAWLTSNFTDTGLSVTNSSASTFELYSKTYASGSTVTLGSNTVTAGDTNLDIYMVIVVPMVPTLSVNLSSISNVNGLVDTGSPVSSGGLDGLGNAYSETLTGTSISWTGATFSFGTSGTANAVTSKTIALPTGNYSRLEILATGVRGNQPNQTFTVTYMDGSRTSILQSLSDWQTPQNYQGETMVSTLPSVVTTTGVTAVQSSYIYGYSLILNTAKAVQSITLPNNRDVVALALTLLPVTPVNSACNPMLYGAAGDSVTDNTVPLQTAINACATQGGGIVELSVVGNQAVYLTGPLTLKSHVQLQIDHGATLQAINDHSRYAGAYINWVYQPNEALISANGASYVGIIGSGTIDGAGGQLQPDGSPSWWTASVGMPTSTRPWLLEFYRCDQVTISGVTLQNSPMWNQALRFSTNITESGVTVDAPGGSPNTDGVDLVGSTNVTLLDLNINDGDDNIAIKSGLPIDITDSKQVGIPQIATSQVMVNNITAGSGHGISIGSEASNGVNNVVIQNVHFSYTGWGFRIKTGRDRGSQIYGITFEDAVMTGVPVPISINDDYPELGGPTEPPYQSAAPITVTTPYVHDITIQNVTATDAVGYNNGRTQSFIEGLPESCIHNVTMNNVRIQSTSLGIDLRHMTGVFTNVTSTPAAPNAPFLVQENVAVVTAGTTPGISTTPPQTGQIACEAQVVPGT